MNTLKIKYFDNLLDYVKSDKDFIQNSGHKFLYEYEKQLDSFMEYEIDGKNLMSFFWDGDYRGFLAYNTGLLGFVSRAYDELMIKYFLKTSISRADIIGIYKKYGISIKEQRIDFLIEEFEKDNLVIYGCRVCLDCTRVKLKIELSEDHYIWTISPEHKYTFGKEDYEKEFMSYRLKVRENSFGKEASVNLYQFWR